ncbi:transcriptional repressor LexA [Aidingimonas halophila]|uniref:LexA repressor n=1 Tax=Aidingimonas halophila TaxID=574349 RepID=A0A1H3B412_9GAMM|nr:transcriptional repressor LexA [Aidingimonas halophila]GHC25867.1 LexA repressor [Aidingimonas halophila]SDX36672.1 SOS-response transcriptional repressor, LexA [Aidingimonas halophila]
MARSLTPRQQNVYDFIVKTMNELGYPPTRAEIARALGFRSPNAAEEHLRALNKKGVIRMIAGTSRGIRLIASDDGNPSLVEDDSDNHPVSTGLPIIGEVAAGSPILAEEHVDRYCPLAPDFFSPKADYLLRVRGLSMKDIGIYDGDLLAVHRTDQVRDGQIVVARLEDDVTVKRFQRHGRHVRLVAENTDYPSIEIDLATDHLEIEGVGVGVIRGGNGQALH